MDRAGSPCAIGVYFSGYFSLFVLGDCMYSIWFCLGDTLEINCVFSSIVSRSTVVGAAYISRADEQR